MRLILSDTIHCDRSTSQALMVSQELQVGSATACFMSAAQSSCCSAFSDSLLRNSSLCTHMDARSYSNTQWQSDSLLLEVGRVKASWYLSSPSSLTALRQCSIPFMKWAEACAPDRNGSVHQ